MAEQELLPQKSFNEAADDRRRKRAPPAPLARARTRGFNEAADDRRRKHVDVAQAAVDAAQKASMRPPTIVGGNTRRESDGAESLWGFNEAADDRRRKPFIGIKLPRRVWRQ